jgi:outer membrane protein OmpA-like peptidoglycan-associated protein
MSISRQVLLALVFAAGVLGQPAIVRAQSDAGGMTLDVCPNDYRAFPRNAPPLTCGCTAEAVRGVDQSGASRSVFGANPYMIGSNVCRAALQAGAVDPKGGQVVVTMAPDTPVFPAVTRHGVSSLSWNTPGLGFRVRGSSQTGEQPTVGVAVVPDGGLALDVCPNEYRAFPKEAPPLTCSCSPESVRENDQSGAARSIFGANPYAVGSHVCRAALQAGVVGPKGGQVMVTPAPNTPVFPAVTRNGVNSLSWTGANFGFRVAAVPKAAGAAGSADAAAEDSTGRGKLATGAGEGLVDSMGRPIQAPIAATLKSAGHVQVYINFVTDSAQLQSSSDKVLKELLAALQQSPELKVDLIGHTDSVGNSQHNQDLSERRAASVYLWLSQHGIARERLHSSGRGFLEPIATNDTNEGRALNRRVEVKAVN